MRYAMRFVILACERCHTNIPLVSQHIGAQEPIVTAGRTGPSPDESIMDFPYFNSCTGPQTLAVVEPPPSFDAIAGLFRKTTPLFFLYFRDLTPDPSLPKSKPPCISRSEKRGVYFSGIVLIIMQLSRV